MDEPNVAALVRSSHEWDGAGYPDALRGGEIPLGARIVFVCSAYEDMRTHRPHRRALTPAQALVELRRGAGSKFDPDVVAAFEEVLDTEREPLRLTG
jgi:HD-GYP domain-containing protein (c-di-GMP phosphodiesterase class II)